MVIGCRRQDDSEGWFESIAIRELVRVSYDRLVGGFKVFQTFG